MEPCSPIQSWNNPVEPLGKCQYTVVATGFAIVFRITGDLTCFSFPHLIWPYICQEYDLRQIVSCFVNRHWFDAFFQNKEFLQEKMLERAPTITERAKKVLFSLVSQSKNGTLFSFFSQPFLALCAAISVSSHPQGLGEGQRGKAASNTDEAFSCPLSRPPYPWSPRSILHKKGLTPSSARWNQLNLENSCTTEIWT